MDCVLSYHLNPLTCGVAKFNQNLSKRLGVPLLSVFDPEALRCQKPLLSLKITEFAPRHIPALERLLDRLAVWELFMHSFSGMEIELRMIRQAKTVYCGNLELIAQIRSIRIDLVEAWCPGTFLDAHPFPDAEISLFGFGMAHKIRTEFYRKLDTLLQQTGKSYCFYLSTALHDGTSFEGSFKDAYEELRQVFGDKIYFLGFLADTTVYNYLHQATFFAAFFEKGVRSNNTSVHLAMECGAVVITNLDQFSPSIFVHLENMIDIAQCRELPLDSERVQRISERAKETAKQIGWEALMGRMTQR